MVTNRYYMVVWVESTESDNLLAEEITSIGNLPSLLDRLDEMGIDQSTVKVFPPNTAMSLADILREGL